MGSDIAHTPTAAALLRNVVQKYGKKNQKMKEKSRITSSIFVEVCFENQSKSLYKPSPQF